eukprot:CAMPEP_0202472570 /NCGR_PEP_ID=MMETSP1360-20130828/88230_1 /ASSEMBLY_ACC=CAM_ASM_000848 /TAXON_ID=515479 /ORGANISM="Licmophora paradoxa, Strain CCMP2313" /LENGTH=55 /DNA_ID=CAMNT_0049099115 /DNA_START=14 /DNA_END=179 /DNA_ORIENTATION=-
MGTSSRHLERLLTGRAKVTWWKVARTGQQQLEHVQTPIFVMGSGSEIVTRRSTGT